MIKLQQLNVAILSSDNDCMRRHTCDKGWYFERKLWHLNSPAATQ